ncbi:MAG TPA: hypothetical protein VGD10_10185 [Allosphingosinicella sp.]|uniref:hypothetical protein n=1 Tax=Allosphingosinicella sp. TaxID=2823234 RepID=UPI002ED80876
MRVLFAIGGLAFVPVALDHLVRFPDQPLAFCDAVFQILLVVLEFAILPRAPLGTVLLVGNMEYLPGSKNGR